MPKPMMSPKIDDELTLGAGGTTVRVGGPAGKWDKDNLLVGFSAVVAQVVREDSGAASIVTSMGWTKYTDTNRPPGTPPEWYLTAEVMNGGALRSGGAIASAWALYALKDGSSWVYEWRLPVTLV
ncbi:MAG TPA: hypothetical protein VGJ11_09575 [Gaiellales bacterium]|jgi:hypothetical protein